MATFLKYDRFSDRTDEPLSEELKDKIDLSQSIISTFLLRCKKPVMAFSGGKDSIVLAALCSKRIPNSISDVSFMFERSKSEAYEIGKSLGLSMVRQENLRWDWLMKNPQYCAPPMKLQSKLYSMRQQKTVKTYAKKNGYDGIIYGRRKQENTVKNPLYYLADKSLQCHPLYDWTTDEIWQYIHHFKLPYPSLYNHEIGKKEGFTPFLLPPEHFGGNVWEAIYDYEPTVVHQFAHFYQPAKDYLNEK